MVALFIHSTVFIFTGLVMDAGKLARRQDGKKRVILCSSAISMLSSQGKLLGQGFAFFSRTNVILGFAANLGDGV